jgi:hypothetical protein
MNDFTVESKREKKEKDESLALLRRETVQAHNLVRVKNRELKRLRLTAQTMVDQRSDVEELFYQAMAEVKTRKAQQRRDKYVEELSAFNKSCRRRRDRERGRFPSVHAVDNREADLERVLKEDEPENPDKTAIKLAQLDWADREDVLRILFAKMNAAALAREAKHEVPEVGGVEARDVSKAVARDSTFLTTAMVGNEDHWNENKNGFGGMAGIV